jgi:hypothetical protein
VPEFLDAPRAKKLIVNRGGIEFKKTVFVIIKPEKFLMILIYPSSQEKKSL